MTDVRLTQTGEQTLQSIESFLEQRIGADDAEDFVISMVQQAGAAIGANPLMFPLDLNAQARGVQLRRWIDPTGKYVCLFRHLPQINTVLLDIFASTRQDYMSLLYLVQISRP